MIKGSCVFCKKPFSTRHQIKYCSGLCQKMHRNSLFVDRWDKGLETGMIGISTRVTSAHIRTFLIFASGEKCSHCGWNEKNPLTGKVPLEVDHIDGDSENNAKANLRLLCPNCHSLTPYFRNLNKGRGRKWRTSKYKKNNER